VSVRQKLGQDTTIFSMRLRLARRTAVDLRAWTGLTGPQLYRLIDKLWQACPDAGRGRGWALSFPDRVPLLVLAYRSNLTMEQLASLFGISDSTVHRVIDRLARHLAKLLGPPPTDRGELWIVDSTLIPVHDKNRTAKSENYRRGVTTQIMCRARDRRIVAVSPAWPGNRNDTVVFRETLGQTLPDHPRLIGDGGYRGNERVTSPRRGPDGRVVRVVRVVRDRNHKRFRKRRARAEHTIARLKDHQLLRPCRRRGETIDHAIAGIAAPRNLKLETA
jgi:hypothetical protein